RRGRLGRRAGQRLPQRVGHAVRARPPRRARGRAAALPLVPAAPPHGHAAEVRPAHQARPGEGRHGQRAGAGAAVAACRRGAGAGRGAHRHRARGTSEGMSFRAVDPSTGEELEPVFPRNTPDEVEACLASAAAAAPSFAATDPAAVAGFLDDWAKRIDADAARLATIAQRETGLPAEGRFGRNEIPRMTGQLRQAAEAARTSSWTHPDIAPRPAVRSPSEPLGKPVLVFGPNNFPFAFNAVGGGDCAAALAARSPVIAKAHPGHPSTTQGLFDHGRAALVASGLPAATLQVLYDVAPEVGLRLAGDARLGAIGFTGSRASGLALKAAADASAGPVYLEMSSVNPVFILPGAIAERGAAIADELTASCQLGGGQFCTNPGLVVVVEGQATRDWLATVAHRYGAAPPALLLGRGVLENLEAS